MRQATKLLLMLLLVVVSTSGAWAQEAKPADGSKVELTWEQFVKITGYDPA